MAYEENQELEWARQHSQQRYTKPLRFVRASSTATALASGPKASGEQVQAIYAQITAATPVASTSQLTLEEQEQQQVAIQVDDKATDCPACQCSVAAQDWERHKSSISHQFARSGPGRIIPPAHFQVAGVGRSMLEKSGWGGECGLGAQGQGRLGPIPTRLKSDKLGIGLLKDHSTAKVSLTKDRPISLRRHKKKLKQEKESWQAVYGSLTRNLDY